MGGAWSISSGCIYLTLGAEVAVGWPIGLLAFGTAVFCRTTLAAELGVGTIADGTYECHDGSRGSVDSDIVQPKILL